MKERPGGSLISYFSNRVKREGGINLAQGTPGFPPPPELLRILRSSAENSKLHQYPPGIGNFELLESVRRHFASLAPLETDNLLIVQGATEGIFLSFFYLVTLLERPFSALSFDPVYESYPKLAEMFGIPFVYVDFKENLTVDFDELEKVIEEKNVKVIFIASPGNPLGKIWTRGEMVRMVALSQEYGFYILFDAVYKDIYFDEEPFNPLCLGHDKLFFIDSFSKMFSITGWRVGYLVTGREHMQIIRGMHDYTGLCAPSILQEAIARYISAHEYGKEYSKTVRTGCKRSYGYMKEQLTALGFDVAPSRGGYFLWARMPREGKYTDAFEFALSLFEKTGVGVVPGENFSLTKTDYIRMNVGTELAVIEGAVTRLKDFHCF